MNNPPERRSTTMILRLDKVIDICANVHTTNLLNIANLAARPYLKWVVSLVICIFSSRWPFFDLIWGFTQYKQVLLRRAVLWFAIDTLISLQFRSSNTSWLLVCECYSFDRFNDQRCLVELFRLTPTFETALASHWKLREIRLDLGNHRVALLIFIVGAFWGFQGNFSSSLKLPSSFESRWTRLIEMGCMRLREGWLFIISSIGRIRLIWSVHVLILNHIVSLALAKFRLFCRRLGVITGFIKQGVNRDVMILYPPLLLGVSFDNGSIRCFGQFSKASINRASINELRRCSANRINIPCWRRRLNLRKRVHLIL